MPRGSNYQKPYPPEFRREAVELYRASGRSLKEIANDAQSMGSKGDCFDNAAIESYHATIEKEPLRGRSFRSRREARSAVFDWIECWYNRERRHSRLGYRSPEQFERDYHERGDDYTSGTDEMINRVEARAA
jgi:transposase InsO family protein